MDHSKTILVLDNDDKYRKTFAEALERGGFRVQQCRKAQSALVQASVREPAMIVSEVKLPDGKGMSLLRAYRRAFPERRTAFVFLSYAHKPSQIVRSIEAGADDHWSKGHPLEVVAARVGTMLRRRKESEDVRRGTARAALR